MNRTFRIAYAATAAAATIAGSAGDRRSAAITKPLPIALLAARVAAGAVLSVALVGTGYRVFSRTGGRVGGIALAATGIAGGYLDVVAATAISASSFSLRSCGVNGLTM